MTNKCLSLAIHGGAGALAERDYTAELAHMRGLIEAGRDALRAGASALDVAVETVAALEASGLYVAGRGASPNSAGRFELDASLMDGPTRRVGAVAALVGFASPIRAARAVMEKTPHVLLAGDGAAAFAAAEGLEPVGPEWFTPVGWGGIPRLQTGTVGCVALDETGALAGATSTGGVRGKLPGRSNDSASQRVLDPCPMLDAGLAPLAKARLLGRYGAQAPELIRSAAADELTSIGASPSLWAELRWAARAEGVVHLDDLLLRRVRLGIIAPQGGLPLMDRIRSIAQPELGWEDARWQAEATSYASLWRRCYSAGEA